MWITHWSESILLRDCLKVRVVPIPLLISFITSSTQLLCKKDFHPTSPALNNFNALSWPLWAHPCRLSLSLGNGIFRIKERSRVPKISVNIYLSKFSSAILTTAMDCHNSLVLVTQHSGNVSRCHRTPHDTHPAIDPQIPYVCGFILFQASVNVQIIQENPVILGH